MSTAAPAGSPCRFLVLSIGKRASFHDAVLRALTDLADGSERPLTGVHPGVELPSSESPETARTPVYTRILGKARAFLDSALPTAELCLVTADNPDRAARAVRGLPAAGAAGPVPLVLVDAAGAGLSTAPFETAVAEALRELADGLPGGLGTGLGARHTAVYTENPETAGIPGTTGDGAAVQVARPYPLHLLPADPWTLAADVVRLFGDHVQRWLNDSAARVAARDGVTTLADALHGFLTGQAGSAWGLHYYTGSVVSGLIEDLDRLAGESGNPVLRGPSEHSLACGALARWQLDEAPFLTVVTSGMVDEFRGTLANLREARARGFVVCADSPSTAWYPFQGTVHGAEDSRAVLAARGVPHVYLDDPDRLPADLGAAYAAYHEDRGPVVLLATPAVLRATGPLPAGAGAGAVPGRRPAASLTVREDQLAPVADLVNHGPGRLLWQVGRLDHEEAGLVHDIARRAGVALADSLTRPGQVSRYRDGRVVPEYLGTLGLYGFSWRVHSYLHSRGRLRPRSEQCLLFLKSRIAEAATPFSPRVLRRSLRIAQVTREPAHLAPFTDHPVLADARGFLHALRERLDVAPEVLAARAAALADARESASDAVHELPVLPMSANHFFGRLRQVLDELITTEGYTYTGVYDVGRGGLSAVRNLPRTGPGFSGWYGRALMGDALQAVPAVALTRDDNVLAFIGDGAAALVPDIVPALVQQVCLYGHRLRRNVTVFRLVDGGHSVIRTYHEGRADAELSRQNQVVSLPEPEWSRSFGPLTVHHRHLADPSGAELRDLLRQPATVNLCSVPLSHNNEGDGLSLLSSHGWQRDELSDLTAAMIRTARNRAGLPGS
ncbi:hypothetical protein V1L54_01135 [Streptomyces sp. TRM 70361]|uniref:hypothetical protein n=1 Tax=Streptomyces sp. TRM 70361 TaxID=3116553 RepID=UPI002E7B29CA|nr:hypothetical protein [Streptomyces sp. TRM 70361]MEE1938035.1 hypothetical protein [Streptomyces sp. TRM 70361]